nr:MAG TPA: hypothetical protein [Caudoviricetes sp.]
MTLCRRHRTQMIRFNFHNKHLFNDYCVRGYPHVRTLNRVESSGLWISSKVNNDGFSPTIAFHIPPLINYTPFAAIAQVIRTNDIAILAPNIHVRSIKRHTTNINQLANQIHSIEHGDGDRLIILFHK